MHHTVPLGGVEVLGLQRIRTEPVFIMNDVVVRRAVVPYNPA